MLILYIGFAFEGKQALIRCEAFAKSLASRRLNPSEKLGAFKLIGM
jgi:hypothetical protein